MLPGDDEVLIDPSQNAPDFTIESIQEDNTDDVMHVVLKCSLVCVTFYKRGWLILNFQFNLVHEGK